jgi:hypothetical protein
VLHSSFLSTGSLDWICSFKTHTIGWPSHDYSWYPTLMLCCHCLEWVVVSPLLYQGQHLVSSCSWSPVELEAIGTEAIRKWFSKRSKKNSEIISKARMSISKAWIRSNRNKNWTIQIHSKKITILKKHGCQSVRFNI